jgi:hypothetical protein
MRRYLLVLICLLLAAGALLAACDRAGPEIRGSGNLTTESRAVSGFDRIVVSGQGVIHVDISGTESLEVEAEDNILDVLTTKVVNGRLELSVEPLTNIRPTREITYRITATQLRGVSISGSGQLDVSTVDTDAFEVRISGSGTVTPTGTSTHLDVEISGSGQFQGADLVSTTGSVNVSGSGAAVVNVTDDLSASVSGSGTIRYLGDPARLETSVSGSGSISRR